MKCRPINIRLLHTYGVRQILYFASFCMLNTGLNATFWGLDSFLCLDFSLQIFASKLSVHNGLRFTKRGVIRLDAVFEIRTYCRRIRVKSNLLEKLHKLSKQPSQLSRYSMLNDHYFACMQVQSRVKDNNFKIFKAKMCNKIFSALFHCSNFLPNGRGLNPDATIFATFKYSGVPLHFLYFENSPFFIVRVTFFIKSQTFE